MHSIYNKPMKSIEVGKVLLEKGFKIEVNPQLRSEIEDK